MDVEQAKVEMRRLTRIFVRRQANWFKLDDPSITWFEAGKANLDEIEEDHPRFFESGVRRSMLYSKKS